MGDRLSDVEVGNLALGAGSYHAPSKRIELNRLHWLGHVLLIVNACLPYHGILCSCYGVEKAR